jgi:peptide/nickel transport system ATP-binding protein
MEMTLDVRNLRIHYKTMRGYAKAVDGVSFGLRRGEILGVAGESGCGKSTLGNALVLVKPPMYYISGEALFEGLNLFDLPRMSMDAIRYAKISLIPQYAMNAMSPTKKIGVFIKDILGQHGVRLDAAMRERIRERIALVNLPPDVLRKFPVELSGGMKQRALMVIATLLDPVVLIADEITSALDVTSQRYVVDMIADFRDKGIVGSVLFITHDLAVLHEVSDRIMVLYAGQIAEIAPADEIINRPKHPYTRALVRSLPRPGLRYLEEKLEGIPGTPPALIGVPEGCRFAGRCPCASARCSEAEPPTEEIGPDHVIACWNWGAAEGGAER